MSDTERAQISWIKSKLGVDIDDIRRRRDKVDKAIDEIGVQARVREILGYDEQAPGLRESAQRLGERKTSASTLEAPEKQDMERYKALGSVKQEARDVVPALVEKSAVGGIRRALAPLLDKCETAIGNSRDPAKTTLSTRLNKLRETLRQTTDDSPKSELDTLEKSARSLLDDALKAGSGNRKDVARERNQTYADMISQRFGVTVTIAQDDDGKYPLQAELEKVYDVLSRVPTEHVMNTSVRKLEIGKVATNRAEYSDTRKAIIVDTIQIKKTPIYSYTIGGKIYPVRTLNAATLHEVGHAVDDKAKVTADASADNFGGWVVGKSCADVAAAYYATITPVPDQQYRQALLGQIESTLYKQGWERPEGVPNDVWRATERILRQCKAIAEDAKPWKTPRPAGDVAYHSTYGKWYGYKLSTRKTTEVSDYQWRSPVEWFAELYAATWLTKTKPPSGVNADAARFMYRGKT